MWKILIVILGNVGCFLVVTTMVDMKLMGKLVHKKSKECPKWEFVIKQPNKIDIQTGYQCAAYSVAYLLRHYGIPATGSDIYTRMPDKMKNGCTYPKGIVNILQEYGFHAKYCSGNLKVLENEISKGNPVIVMIRVRKDKNWLHYVPVVGFDEKYIFIAESLSELVNYDGKLYNRRIEKGEFERLWNTSMIRQPLYKNTFFAVQKAEKA